MNLTKSQKVVAISDDLMPTAVACYHEKEAGFFDKLKMSWPTSTMMVAIRVPVAWRQYRLGGPCGWTDHFVGEGKCPECGKSFKLLGPMHNTRKNQLEAEIEQDPKEAP